MCTSYLLNGVVCKCDADAALWRYALNQRHQGVVVCVVYEQGMTLCTVVIFVSLKVENTRMFLCWSRPLGHVNGAKWLDINNSRT